MTHIPRVFPPMKPIPQELRDTGLARCVEALRESKIWLWDGQGEQPSDQVIGVCAAVLRATSNRPDCKDFQEGHLSTYVSDLLEGYAWFDHWLVGEKRIQLKEEWQYQVLRHEWVDLIIAHFVAEQHRKE